jgi:hypothetical protein
MSRITGNNTEIWDYDGCTFVTLHRTNVVKFNHDKTVLDSGGWKTVTTKRRMNEASKEYGLGYYVYQKDFDWFVSFHNGNPDLPFDGDKIAFTSGGKVIL